MSDTIQCPWCGHAVAHGDLCDFEADGREHRTDCEKCGREFIYVGEPDILWSARRGSA